MAKTELTKGEASEYPILGEIVADIDIDDQGVCAMPAARFAAWARQVSKELPRAKHPRLYQMLGGMALEFAKKRTFASIQLFALATMGLPAPKAEAMAATSDFLTRPESRAAADSFKNAALTPSSGMTKPKPGGASIRRPTAPRKPAKP